MAATKAKRTDLPAIKKTLLARQSGACLFCARDLTRTPSKNVVVDHNHTTGIIRGVAHRGCNGAEGKILNSLRYTGLTSKVEIARLLTNLVAFWLKEPKTEWIYPTHKTPAEKREAANKKRRKAYAAKKAKGKS